MMVESFENFKARLQAIGRNQKSRALWYPVGSDQQAKRRDSLECKAETPLRNLVLQKVAAVPCPSGKALLICQAGLQSR